MWTWLEYWGPVARDLLSLGLAGLGAYLARRSIKMGEAQEAVTAEQMKLMKGQQDLLAELKSLESKQADTAERQREMNERQHVRWLAEEAKFMDLRVNGHSQRQPHGYELPDNHLHKLTVTLRVLNGGDKTANGFYWEVLIPRNLYGAANFVDSEGETLKVDSVHLSEYDTYEKLAGHYDHKLFGFSEIDICRVSVHNTFPRAEEFWIKWRISCEAGGVPGKGHSKIYYRRIADGFYEVKHDHPDESEDLLAVDAKEAVGPVDKSGQES